MQFILCIKIVNICVIISILLIKLFFSCYGDVALCTSESSDDGVNGDEGV